MANWKSAVRSLARQPAFTFTTIAVMAFGIGTTAAMFSIVDTVLLRPLPYVHGERTVFLMDGNPSKSERESLISPGRLADWSRLSRTFDSISGQYTENVTDTSQAEPERLAGRRVAPGYFQALEMSPLAGRVLAASEEQFGGAHAAVISEGLWTRRYHRDPRTIGARLLLSGEAYTVVGVMPKQFAAPSIDVWLPAQTGPELMGYREARFYVGYARIKAGFTIEQARADLASVCERLAERYPKTDKGWVALVQDFKEERIGSSAKALPLMLGSAALLLLLLCANVAGLLLGQLQGRERELAVRSSLGARRGQVAAVILREVFVLGGMSGALGLLVAFAVCDVLTKLFADLPRMEEFQFDWRIAIFTFAAAFMTAMLFGFIPAWQATRGDLNRILAQGGRSQAGASGGWRRALVGAQFTLALVLLSSAGLLLRSYYNLSHVEPGFRAAGVLTFHVGAEWGEDRVKIGLLQQSLLTELRELPGIRAAGFANFLPASEATLREPATVQGLNGARDQGKIVTGTRSVAGQYLQALQVPLLRGSTCPDLQLDWNKPTKVLVNQRFADSFGGDVVGRQLTWANASSAAEIIGVLGNVKEDSLSAPAGPYVYVCIKGGMWPDPEYVVAWSGNRASTIAAIARTVHKVAPQRAVFGMTSLDDYLSKTLDRPRLNTALLVVFGFSAVLSAALGLYGLIALAVTARTREIGLRMALGAEPWRILRQMLAEAGRTVAVSVVLGLALALAAVRLFRSVLFDVAATDTLTFATVCVVLIAVAFTAALIPSFRAARIDPMEALRRE